MYCKSRKGILNFWSDTGMLNSDRGKKYLKFIALLCPFIENIYLLIFSRGLFFLLWQTSVKNKRKPNIDCLKMNVYFKISLFFTFRCWADSPGCPRGLCGLALSALAFQTQLSHNFSLLFRPPLTSPEFPTCSFDDCISSHSISFVTVKTYMSTSNTEIYCTDGDERKPK